MNKGLVFIAISGIVAALILATVVPVQVSAAICKGQQGIDKGREASGNTRSCPGLNEASSHNAGTLSACPLIP